MKFLIPLAFLTAALANPVPEAEAEAEAAPAPNRLTTEAAQGQYCKILASTLNCRYHANDKSDIITTFKKGQSIYFSCYSSGTCVSGNW